MRSSLIIPCNLAISRGHRNAAQTAPSGVLSAIGTSCKEKLKKRAETQENVKFHSQAPPMLVQKFPRQLSTLAIVNLFPEPNICFFKNFVQRRWVYSVVETTSYAKKKKSETYRKEF